MVRRGRGTGDKGHVAPTTTHAVFVHSFVPQCLLYPPYSSCAHLDPTHMHTHPSHLLTLIRTVSGACIQACAFLDPPHSPCTLLLCYYHCCCHCCHCNSCSCCAYTHTLTGHLVHMRPPCAHPLFY